MTTFATEITNETLDSVMFMVGHNNSTSWTNHTVGESKLTLSSQVPQLLNVLLGTLFFLTILATICGNILVIVSIRVERRLRTVFNMYVTNLAVTDVSVALSAMSFYALNTAIGRWPFGRALCTVWIFLDYVLTFASVFTIILISVDRFWAIKWSIHYKQHNNRRKAAIAICIVWLFSVLIWIAPCALDRIHTTDPDDICVWFPHKNRVSAVLVSVLGYRVPTCLMLLAYLSVFTALRRRARMKRAAKRTAQAAKAVAMVGVAAKTDGLANLTLPNTTYEDRRGSSPKGSQKSEARNTTGVQQSPAEIFSDTSNPVSSSHDDYDSVSDITADEGDSSADVIMYANGPSMSRSLHTSLTNDHKKRRLLGGSGPAGDCTFGKPRMSMSYLAISSQATMAGMLNTLHKARQARHNTVAAPATPTIATKPAYTSAPASPEVSLVAFGSEGDIVSVSSQRKNRASVKKVYTEVLQDSPSKVLEDGQTQTVSQTEDTATGRNRLPTLSEFVTRKIVRRPRISTHTKLFMTLSVIVISYVICWVPFQFVFDISIAGPDYVVIPEAVNIVTYWFAYCNSTLNPILYAFTNKDFRDAFRRILTGRYC